MILTQWTGKRVAPLRKKRKVSLKKEKVKSHKMTLNILIVESKGIISEIAIRN